MSEPYIGEIRPFAFGFYPGDGCWLPCDGATLSIQAYSPLYAVIGTTYGGDGQTNFKVPDLRGLPMLGAGQGQALQNYALGQKTGMAVVSLNPNQNAPHNHTVTGINAQTVYAAPTTASHLSRVSDSQSALGKTYTDQPVTANTFLDPTTLVSSGGGQPHDNTQPWLAFTYAIAVNGVFPVPD